MVASGVVFFTHVSPCHILIPYMPQSFPPGSLALSHVVESAYGGRLCPGPTALLLLRIVRKQRHALPFPVCPYMGQLVSGEKWVPIFLVQGVSIEHIVFELLQDSCSLAVFPQLLLQVIAVDHEADYCPYAPVPG